MEIAYGYCHCGCGEKTNLVTVSCKKRGVKKGEPSKFISGHNVIPKTVEERLWSKVDVKGPDDCWNWQEESRDGKGYGAILFRKKIVKAHRVAWIITNGEIPDGLFVLHKCDNRACCNPNHHFLGTNMDNVLDMMAKDRCAPTRARGEGSGISKFTDAQILAIRAKHDGNLKNFSATAREYGVTPSTIINIVYRKTWAHI